MTRACGADDIKNILYPALFRKLRFQMIDDTQIEEINLAGPHRWIRRTEYSPVKAARSLEHGRIK